MIGTILQYPNIEDAWQASNGLRVSITRLETGSEDSLSWFRSYQSLHDTETCRCPSDGGNSHATKIVYRTSSGDGSSPRGEV